MKLLKWLKAQKKREPIASMDILPARIDNLQCEIADPWAELEKAEERYLAAEEARRIKERFGRKLKRVR